MSELSLVERGIQKCFGEHRCLGNIARRELLDEKNFEKCDGKVEKLAWIAIKSIMKKRMMDADEEDVYHQIIYKLIFREPITNCFEDFSERGPTWSKSTDPEQHPADGDPRKAHFRRLRSDGAVVLALLKQEAEAIGQLEIIVSRRALCIRLHSYIAEIPNREGVEFDTYWAEKFAKMAFRKHVLRIMLEMDGEGVLVYKYMRDYIQREIIDRLPRIVPTEPWERVISRKRPVYERFGDIIYNQTHFAAQFQLRWKYYTNLSFPYWGYLE